MTIVTPGKTAPLESVTRPTTSAVVTCAATQTLRANRSATISQYLLNSASRDHPHGQFCNRLHEMCGIVAQDATMSKIAGAYCSGGLRPPTIHNLGDRRRS